MYLFFTKKVVSTVKKNNNRKRRKGVIRRTQLLDYVLCIFCVLSEKPCAFAVKILFRDSPYTAVSRANSPSFLLTHTADTHPPRLRIGVINDAGRAKP